jgi:hypothetical protein
MSPPRRSIRHPRSAPSLRAFGARPLLPATSDQTAIVGKKEKSGRDARAPRPARLLFRYRYPGGGGKILTGGAGAEEGGEEKSDS